MLCPCAHFGHIYPIFYPQFPAAVTFLHSNYSDFIQNKQGLMWTSPILNQCEYFGHFTSKGRNLGIKMGHCQNLPLMLQMVLQKVYAGILNSAL